MKKRIVSLALLLATAFTAAPDVDAGRQRVRVKVVETPKGGHRTRNKTRLDDHQIADGRRGREQTKAAEKQQAAKGAGERKRQAAAQIKAGERKKQRTRGGN